MKKHICEKNNNIDDEDELFYQLLSPTTTTAQQQELYDELMLILTTPPNPNSNPNAPQSSPLLHPQGSTTTTTTTHHQQPHIGDAANMVTMAAEVGPDLNPSHSIGDKKRKTVHREVERQRRQDMASLYASLRSHLPSQLIKGKRSISDHIHETVTYIKQLQKQIKGLNDRKADLKRILSLDYNNSTDDSITATPQEIINLQKNNNYTRYGDSRVMVKPCLVGVEVSINTDITQGIPLSRVLGFLLQEQGLTVIRCTSTRINQRMLHFIESEVNDRRENSYLRDLQPRLINNLLLCGKS